MNFRFVLEPLEITVVILWELVPPTSSQIQWCICICTDFLYLHMYWFFYLYFYCVIVLWQFYGACVSDLKVKYLYIWIWTNCRCERSSRPDSNGICVQNNGFCHNTRMEFQKSRTMRRIAFMKYMLFLRRLNRLNRLNSKSSVANRKAKKLEKEFKESSAHYFALANTLKEKCNDGINILSFTSY